MLIIGCRRIKLWYLIINPTEYNFTNGNPDSGNPQKIINDDTSNPFKDE